MKSQTDKIQVSVIIPVYNREDLICSCLESIFRTKYSNFEVIVIDDGSTDNTARAARQFACRIITNGKNMGVSYARNEGARHSQGELLYFVDSDVIQDGDNISKIVAEFRNDPKLEILVASLNKEPLNKGFGPAFIALKYFYQTTNLLIRKNLKKHAVTFLSTCSLAIKRDVFDKAGGFDTSLRFGGEEHELGHRLAKNHTTYIFRDILVTCNHQSILKRAITLFKRGTVYAPIFFKWKKFEPIGSVTKKEAYLTILVLLTTVTVFIGLLLPQAFIIVVLLFAVFLISNLGFYYFALKQKNLLFVLMGVFSDFLFYVVKGLSISLSFLKYFVNK